jgi:predicted RNA-binding protein with PIN domain
MADRAKYKGNWGANAALSAIYGSRGTTDAPLMLVDGYNVVLKDPVLSNLMENGDGSQARELLRNALFDYAAFRELNLSLIWDAMSRADATQGVNRIDQKGGGFEEVFAASMSADAWIYKTIDEALAAGITRCVVASSDGEVQLFSRRFTDTGGVAVCSSEELLKDLGRAKQEQKMAVRREKQRRMIKDPGANPFASLAAVRDDLVERERGDAEIPEWMRKYL